MDFLVKVCILAVTINLVACQSLEWKYTYDNDPLQILRGLEPAGDEDTVSHLYVCRAMHSGHWVPGKLYMDPRQYKYYCNIPEGGERVYTLGQHHDIQALVTPPGWTSWVPLEDRFTLPPNAIQGGTHPDDEPAYVCRHKDGDGRILVGKYSIHAGYCYYSYFGEKHAESDVDVLTLNQLGMAVRTRENCGNVTLSG